MLRKIVEAGESSTLDFVFIFGPEFPGVFRSGNEANEKEQHYFRPHLEAVGRPNEVCLLWAFLKLLYLKVDVSQQNIFA